MGVLHWSTMTYWRGGASNYTFSTFREFSRFRTNRFFQGQRSTVIEAKIKKNGAIIWYKDMLCVRRKAYQMGLSLFHFHNLIVGRVSLLALRWGFSLFKQNIMLRTCHLTVNCLRPYRVVVHDCMIEESRISNDEIARTNNVVENRAIVYLSLAPLPHFYIQWKEEDLGVVWDW